MILERGAPPIEDLKKKKDKNDKGKKIPVPPKPKINERTIPRKFILTVLRDGFYEPMSDKEFEQW